jgi:hypothetical protein
MTQQNEKSTVAGIILTIAVVIVFACGLAWFHWPSSHQDPTLKAQLNELHTFERLQSIVAAQEKYRTMDVLHDGRKAYAGFAIHLWQSVAPDGRKVPVNLISRQLAFATEPDQAIDGYFFIDMHQHTLQDGVTKPMDDRAEWAVFAMPASNPPGGEKLFLLADANGIWAKRAKYVAAHYPSSIQTDGWAKASSPADLAKLQK